MIPQLVTDLDLTFRAFDSSKSELQDAIGKSPEALATLTKVIPVERRLFAAGAVLMHKLQPGAAVLPETAPVLADALEAGANNLQLVPKFAQRLTVGTDYLADYATYPGVVPGSLRVAETANALYPLMNFITPAETTCSYLSLMLRNVNSTLARVTRHRHRDPSDGSRGRHPAQQRAWALLEHFPQQAREDPGRAPQQPVPEYGVARADLRVRGGQRALHPEPPGDRERPGPAEGHDRGPVAAMRRLERSRLSLTVWAAIGTGALLLILVVGFLGTRAGWQPSRSS